MKTTEEAILHRLPSRRPQSRREIIQVLPSAGKQKSAAVTWPSVPAGPAVITPKVELPSAVGL